MRMKVFFAVFVAVLMAISGYVFAGPGDKGKVVIEHAPPSDKGKGTAIVDGSVELEVSVPAAIAHLANHDGDCVVEDTGDQISDSENCDPVVE